MAKLTDSQLVILSVAAQRKDGAVLPLPKSLKIKGGAVTKTLDDLRKKGLLEEKPATPDTEAWREGGRRMMLVITDLGLRAIDGGPGQKTNNKPANELPAKKRHGRATRKPAAANSASKQSRPSIRPGTKQALLVDLLKRKSGASIDEIVKAIGWQAHSVRGAISGTLKKKFGLTVTSGLVGKRRRVYRIVDAA
jgi:hypothetical protein